MRSEAKSRTFSEKGRKKQEEETLEPPFWYSELWPAITKAIIARTVVEVEEDITTIATVTIIIIISNIIIATAAAPEVPSTVAPEATSSILRRPNRRNRAMIPFVWSASSRSSSTPLASVTICVASSARPGFGCCAGRMIVRSVDGIWPRSSFPKRSPPTRSWT